MTPSYGIIVGRFQVGDLHEGHLELLRTVRGLHSRVFVFVGVSPLLGTRRNPLDFQTRKAMIQAKFPDITVLHMPDMNEDKAWVQELDKRIREVAPLGEITLYGGRDSFASVYDVNDGQFSPVISLANVHSASGEVVRSVISGEVLETSDFRKGIIYVTQNQFAKGVPCVDIIPWDGSRILLAGKPGESRLRFVGGHFSPQDASLEAAAERELYEETGLVTLSTQYIGSARINDWRYKKEDDTIVTSLFFSHISSITGATAKDDIDRIKWIPMDGLEAIEVVSAHTKLKELAIKHIKGMLAHV